MEWLPLSVREGTRRPDGPYEGVPAHLREPLMHWLEQAFGIWASDANADLAVQVTAASRVSSFHRIPHGTGYVQIKAAVLAIAEHREALLDAVDACLQLPHHARPEDLGALNNALRMGGSVWRAGPAGLIHQIDRTATAAYEQAATPADTASEELREAWHSAYGRNPDASDAWDHAIKAVEAVLIPIVVPTQAGAHMGHVVGQLDHQGAQWKTMLRFNQTTAPVNPPTTSVQALVGMLRLLYPNPDRHVGPDHRTPTLEEARAVVHLAVTIVQWARDGQITPR